MVGRAAAALALTAAVSAAAFPIAAQALARLTVESFSLIADTNRVRVDVPFHVIVGLHVSQRVGRINNLQLPILADVELLGDERQTIGDVHGTRYVERITVVAHHGGAITFAPATLQAIDGRDGKAKQWFSNSLTVYVAESSAPTLRRIAAVTRWILSGAVALTLVIAGMGVLALVGLLIVRRPRVVAAVPSPPLPSVVARSPRGQLQDALTVLRAQPTRATAIAIRGAVWRMLGAAETETLGDMLALRVASDQAMRSLLIALERSAFTYDEDLNDAIAATVTALERAIENVE